MRAQPITATVAAFIAVVASLSLSLPAMAGDADQPIGIEADFAEFNREKGITIYNGKVLITQGTRRFWADKVHIYTNERDEMEKIIALGKPARFRHKEAASEQEAFAEADRIEFLSESDQLILLRAAKVWKGNDSIVSERIVYNTESGKVQTGSTKTRKQTTNGKPAKKGRVRMTLQPSSR